MLNITTKTFGSLENNCYLITDDTTKQSALIDCTDSSKKMLDMIKGTDLRYILLTHCHFDHIGGVSKVKEITGAKVAVSSLDEPGLRSSRKSLAAFCGQSQENIDADIMLNDGDTITLGDTVIKVMMTPGHTVGGVCYIADDSIFTGDTLFFCSCGRTDFPGGSSDDMLGSLHRIASLEGDYNIYPGHDRQSKLSFERQNNPYMK